MTPQSDMDAALLLKKNLNELLVIVNKKQNFDDYVLPRLNTKFNELDLNNLMQARQAQGQQKSI